MPEFVRLTNLCHVLMLMLSTAALVSLSGCPSPPPAQVEVGAIWNEVQLESPWQARKGHTGFTQNYSLAALLGGEREVPGVGPVFLNDVWLMDAVGVWYELTEHAEWPARAEAAVASRWKQIVLVGGRDDTHVFNDVWQSTDGAEWQEVAANAPWAARFDHTATWLGKSIYLMGGEDAAGNHLNDVWKSSDGIEWEQATQHAPWAARSGHTVCGFGGRLWLLGGMGSDGTCFSDVWSTADGHDWRLENDAPGWSPRSEHVSEVFEKRLWLVGGRDNQGGLLGDVWFTDDGENWKQRTLLQPCFGGGGGAEKASAVADDTMWMFGGVEDDGVCSTVTRSTSPFYGVETSASTLQRGDEVVVKFSSVESFDPPPAVWLGNRVKMTLESETTGKYGSDYIYRATIPMSASEGNYYLSILAGTQGAYRAYYASDGVFVFVPQNLRVNRKPASTRYYSDELFEVDVTVSTDTSAALTHFSLTDLFPLEWQFDHVEAPVTPVVNRAADGALSFVWDTLPPLPFDFKYFMRPQVDAVGNPTLSGFATFDVNGDQEMIKLYPFLLLGQKLVFDARDVGATGYVPGRALEIKHLFKYTPQWGISTNLVIKEELPPGWTLLRVGANSRPPDIVQDGQTLNIFWGTVPSPPIEFSYFAMPSYESIGPQTISGSVDVRLGGAVRTESLPDSVLLQSTTGGEGEGEGEGEGVPEGNFEGEGTSEGGGECEEFPCTDEPGEYCLSQHVTSGNTYLAGSELLLRVRVSHIPAPNEERLTALAFYVDLPENWLYLGVDPSTPAPSLLPITNSGRIEFAWIVPPQLPATVLLRLQPNAAGPVRIQSQAYYRLNGDAVYTPWAATCLTESAQWAAGGVGR